jgi:hypothetical protein
MPSALATLLLLVSFVAAQTSPSPNEQVQPGGTITGIVTNNDGDPIERALLCTDYATPNGSSTSCGSTETGRDGKFELHVALGEIGVFATKQEGGYWPVVDVSPSQQKGVYKVTLTKEAPTATVTLKIGPRPGELKFDVKDKATGKPVEGFGVRWIAVDNARMMSTDLPRTYAIVPPDVDVIVEVHADGYRRWFYIDPSNPSQPTLRLALGEVRHFDVELEPAEKN